MIAVVLWPSRSLTAFMATPAAITSSPHLDMFELSRRMGHSTYRLTADTYSYLYEMDDPTLDDKLDAAFSAATPVAPVVRPLFAAFASGNRLENR